MRLPILLTLTILAFTTLTQASTAIKPSDARVEKLGNYRNIIPVAIIGGGPGGLSAAVVTSEALLYTVVFQGKQIGGPLNVRTPVGNWPGVSFSSGDKLISKIQKQVIKREDGKVVLSAQTIEKVDFSKWPFALKTPTGDIVHALTVIIATGSTPRKLGIPGEDSYWGKGVGFDPDPIEGNNIIVIGGGDDAIRKAHELLRENKTVTLLVRGKKMSAAKWRQKYVLKQGLKVLWNTQLKEILGDGQKVTGVKLLTGKQMSIDGIVVAIGRNPNSTLFKDQLQLGLQNRIVLKASSQATSVPGVFAAGEVVRVGQAAMAAGDGMKAAYEALEFLDHIGYSDTVEEKLSALFYTTSGMALQKERRGFSRRSKESD